MVGFVEKGDVVGGGMIGGWPLDVFVVALCQSVVLEPISVTWYLLGDTAEWVSVSVVSRFAGGDWKRVWR